MHYKYNKLRSDIHGNKENKLAITEKEGVICYGSFQDGVPQNFM